MTRAHVIGAGLAGLAASLSLADAGFDVTLSEAGPQAGGRCRSYLDPQLGMTIDNGNHLVLSGNGAVRDYLAAIGASDRLTGPDEARFAFVDVTTGDRWAVRPNAGPIPWWLLSAAHRVPGTRLRDYLALARLMRAGAKPRIGDLVPKRGPLWERLLETLLVSALNTPAAEGSAALAGAVIRETLAKGGKASRPLVATPTLSAAFVDPALARLQATGATVRLGRRLRALEIVDERIAGLCFADGTNVVVPGEPVVLAVPAWVATDLLPGLEVPDAHHAIVNAHFRIDPPRGAEPIVGVIGGTAEWVFAFEDRLSTTTSAADALIDLDRDDLARRLWADVSHVHRIETPMPPHRLIIEKRATFAATPEQDRRRPSATTRCDNLWLAGDWTKTGLPATIEGAIRSGRTAAALAIGKGATSAAR
jgi:squalene-associated FAD-dependent desaturase